MTDFKILIVEDDQTLQQVIEYNLTKEGYQVLAAGDGLQGLDIARLLKPDYIILDVMLPKMNGYEVCRTLRKEMSTPILMLTAKGEEIDKVIGLDLGADDYMTKPFSMRELLARVRAGLRRTETQNMHVKVENILSVEDITLDISRHTVTKGTAVLSLTPKEFDLLALLLKNKGLVFNREQLLEKVWGYEYPGDTRTVDVHIRWLREKLENNPDNPQLLLTIRGVGYKLEGK